MKMIVQSVLFADTIATEDHGFVCLSVDLEYQRGHRLLISCVPSGIPLSHFGADLVLSCVGSAGV
jgi:hypothetical protein